MADFDESLLQELPALGETARQLLCLNPIERDDSRVLGLIAQREPVMLARLLSMANSVALRRAHNVTNAQAAIHVLGSERAYAVMLLVAKMQGFASHNCPVRVRNYLLHQAVSVSLTTQRLTRLLQFSSTDSEDAFLAALLDVLGIYALLVVDNPRQAEVLEVLVEHAHSRKALPREMPVLANHSVCACALARRWEAGAAVLEMLDASYQIERYPDSASELAPEVQVRAKALLLAYELVAAKVANSTLSERGLSLVSDTAARPGVGIMQAGRAVELAVLA